MSKRRVSKQQSQRILNKQRSYRDPIENMDRANDGLVITRFGSHALVEDEKSKRIRCSIRPAIDSVVAGDRVVWLPEGDHQGVIVSRYERESVLGRPDKQGQLKPIAANISQILITIAPIPTVSWPLLDSYLIISEHLNLKACIVLNKVDLPCEALKKRLYSQYEPLGYEIVLTTQTQEKSIHDLEKKLYDQTSVFTGQSGVGKSSLIANILPMEPEILTGSISETANLGRHTTSKSTLYHLPTGGTLIDSPGVREFGLWHMPAAEIIKGFREFKPFLAECKFRDCNHQNTPGCALQRAVQKGLIHPDRLQNYLKIAAQFAP